MADRRRRQRRASRLGIRPGTRLRARIQRVPDSDDPQALSLVTFATDLITFRRLSRADFPLLEQWLKKPHVLRWWREPLDGAALEAKYGPRIDGVEPTFVFVIEYDGRPVGWIQWYRWAYYELHARKIGVAFSDAGIDL